MSAPPRRTIGCARSPTLVAEVVPGATVSFASGAGPDARNYRVNCDKIRRLVPGYRPQWTLRQGIEQLYASLPRHQDDRGRILRPALDAGPAHQEPHRGRPPRRQPALCSRGGVSGTLPPITACRACGSQRLETFLSLGDLPPSDAFIAPEALAEVEARYPLDVAFCHACALVQILHTVPPEELFAADYPYFSSVIDALVRHAADNVAARIAERRLGPNSLVVELASNDGYLLQHYLAAGIDVLGIEPTPGPAAAARDKGIDTRQLFFGQEVAAGLVAEGRRADVIHANNVLAHVADTNGFVAGHRGAVEG